MATDLSTGMDIALDGRELGVLLLCSIAFVSETKYLWSGYGEMQCMGQTWSGLGDLGKIANLTETADTQANGASVALSGVANDLLADAMTEVRQGRPVTIWLAFLQRDGSVVPDPYLIYKGGIDKPTTTTGATESEIELAIENRLNDWQRPRISRYTSEDQKRKYPNDTGLDSAHFLADSAWQWGG